MPYYIPEHVAGRTRNNRLMLCFSGRDIRPFHCIPAYRNACRALGAFFRVHRQIQGSWALEISLASNL